MRLFLVGVGVAVLALGGCTTLQRGVGYTQPPNIENPLLQRATRLDAMQAALAAYELEGTTNFGTPGQASIAISNDETYRVRLQGYVNARLDQVDGLCTVFFQGMERLSTNARWTRDQFNALTDFAAIMMGLTGSAADELTMLAGVRGLANDSFEAASTAMLITPDPYRVQSLVTLEQDSRAAAFGARPLDSYREAQRRVREYAHPCTLTGIRELIAESLEQGINSAERGQQIPATLTEPLRVLLNQVERESDPLPGLPTSTLPYLYWAFVLQPSTEELSHILASLPDEIANRVRAALAGSDYVPGIRAALQSVAVARPNIRSQAEERQRTFLDRATSAVMPNTAGQTETGQGDPASDNDTAPVDAADEDEGEGSGDDSA